MPTEKYNVGMAIPTYSLICRVPYMYLFILLAWENCIVTIASQM